MLELGLVENRLTSVHLFDELIKGDYKPRTTWIASNETFIWTPVSWIRCSCGLLYFCTLLKATLSL